MLVLKKIISGGQTGADQGALDAAKILKLETGGWMPRGFKTDTGSRPEFAKLYNLQETESSHYPPRTEQNICQSDGTLIFGNDNSPGCKLTKSLCVKYRKKVYTVPFPNSIMANHEKVFLDWLEAYQIKTLNVAGNRESRNPGIFLACKNFLIISLKDHLHLKS